MHDVLFVSSSVKMLNRSIWDKIYDESLFKSIAFNFVAEKLPNIISEKQGSNYFYNDVDYIQSTSDFPE